MKHMAHVCFSETCTIFFVGSKYVLTKSVEVTNKKLDKIYIKKRTIDSSTFTQAGAGKLPQLLIKTEHNQIGLNLKLKMN